VYPLSLSSCRTRSSPTSLSQVGPKPWPADRRAIRPGWPLCSLTVCPISTQGYLAAPCFYVRPHRGFFSRFERCGLLCPRAWRSRTSGPRQRTRFLDGWRYGVVDQKTIAIVPSSPPPVGSAQSGYRTVCRCWRPAPRPVPQQQGLQRAGAASPQPGLPGHVGRCGTLGPRQQTMAPRGVKQRFSSGSSTQCAVPKPIGAAASKRLLGSTLGRRTSTTDASNPAAEQLNRRRPQQRTISRQCDYRAVRQLEAGRAHVDRSARLSGPP